jgi:hypothetical protein
VTSWFPSGCRLGPRHDLDIGAGGRSSGSSRNLKTAYSLLPQRRVVARLAAIGGKSARRHFDLLILLYVAPAVIAGFRSPESPRLL